MLPPPGSDHAAASRLHTSLGHVLVVARVLLVVTGWLVVFLATMLGYLTLPVLTLAGCLLLFGAIDGLRRLWRRRYA